jgi:hypothetical protein
MSASSPAAAPAPSMRVASSSKSTPARSSGSQARVPNRSANDAAPAVCVVPCKAMESLKG